MLEKILQSPYLIAGLIVFPILLSVGIWLDFSLGEAILGAAGLTGIGVASFWWKDHVW
jgi:hypothetical protein